MYCDDCGALTDLELKEYIKRKESNGTVKCNGCQNSLLRKMARERGRAAYM